MPIPSRADPLEVPKFFHNERQQMCCRKPTVQTAFPRWKAWFIIQGDTKKREILKNPTKIEEIQEKKCIDRNWTITTCLL